MRILYFPEDPMNIEAPETLEVSETRVACDGGGGALGHPKVYLQIGDEGFVECPYCDRRFVLAGNREGQSADRAAGDHGH
jgi:uncharacterized Zn-finger protein